MVLGKLPVSGRPTNLDSSRARAYCACSRCGWGLFGHFFFLYHFSFLSPTNYKEANVCPIYKKVKDLLLPITDQYQFLIQKVSFLKDLYLNTYTITYDTIIY